MDSLRIDSHKLMYHISRVDQWLRHGDVYPIYIEISLYGGCNHRCIFCAFDFLKYQPIALDKHVAKRFISEAAQTGVRSILYSGEGEPLLHKNAVEIINFTKGKGIDTALSTNGVLFDAEKTKKLLASLSWVRVSLNAGSKKKYAAIHRTGEEDFNKVITNLKDAVKIRDTHRYACTIGVQFLLIPQNYREAVVLARHLYDVGVDYLVIKPYSEHPSSLHTMAARTATHKNADFLAKELKRYERRNFTIIFRRHTMEKFGQNKPYEHCLGLPFLTHVTAHGDIYPCNFFIGNKKFIFGNIYKESFKDIWGGKNRKKIMERVYRSWNVHDCRFGCRLDEINRYLWELKHPGPHVNFI